MAWQVIFNAEFELEFDALAEEVQDELLAAVELLKQLGPLCGRPRVDTLDRSDYQNMKELRFDAADGVWRLAFAFDPNQRAVLLVAGDKSGGSQKMFYRQLIAKADGRYARHLAKIKAEKQKGKPKK